MAHRRLIIKERITAIVGSSLLFALVALSYYYSIKVEYDGLKYIPSESSPDFTAENITLTDFDVNGSPKDKLVAKSVAHFSDERMRAQYAHFYSLNPNKPKVSASANEAWSDDGLETIELSGNVFVKRTNKLEPILSFNTEYLKGYLDTYTFETDKAVSMHRGKDLTQASNGMIYSNIDRTIELRSNVTTILHPTSNTSKK